jgi:hypothetical protein
MVIKHTKAISFNEIPNILNLYNKSKSKNIFQHPRYTENQLETTFLFTLRMNDSIVAYCYVNEYSLSKLKSIKYCKIKYGSIGEYNFSIALNNEIVCFYKKHNFTSINYVPFENINIQRIFESKFKIILSKRETGTLLIDLDKKTEEIQSNYSKNLKRNINKASKNNLEILQIENKDDFIQLNNIYNNLFIHRKIPITNRNFTLEIIDFVISNKLGFIFGCYYDKKLIGGAVFVKNNDRIEFFIGASDPKYRELPILHSVFNNAIIFAKKIEVKYFDMGGILISKDDIQLNKITEFKYQFTKTEIKFQKEFEIILSKKRKLIYEIYLKIVELKKWMKN